MNSFKMNIEHGTVHIRNISREEKEELRRFQWNQSRGTNKRD